MDIDNLTPETAILAELGSRLARLRKQQGYSQQELATEAGLGVATLRRIEAGEGSQLDSWLKLLKALNMISGVNDFLPENLRSPMAEALSERSQRRHNGVSGKRWGDEGA